jgi:hypothetical protein
MTVETPSAGYPARLDIDRPEQHDRLSTLFRLILVIPIGLILAVLTAGAAEGDYSEASGRTGSTGGGVSTALIVVTALMIVFRQRYPRWWFDFALELARFGARVGAYLALLTDQYPSTVDEQTVHLDLDYPDVERDLNRWLPLVKWLLALPHYLVLVFLSVGAFFAVVIAWFSILITGRYPQVLFDFVVGVSRWWLRVEAYAFLLVTDKYPPFSLA